MNTDSATVEGWLKIPQSGERRVRTKGAAGSAAVVTFIDYTATFDTVSHKFLDQALSSTGI